MKEEDLRSGMVVKLRDGRLGLVVEHDGTIRIALHGGYLDMGDYYNNLIAFGGLRDFDIMAVGKTVAGNLLNMDESYVTIIWTRKEAKKMTISEIEKELGYKIEVVK